MMRMQQNSEGNPFARWGLSFLLWGFALVSEGGAAYLARGLPLADASMGIGFLSLFFHLISALLLFSIAALHPKESHQNIRFYAYLSGWLTLFLPLIGIVGSSLMFLFVKKILKTKGIVEDYQQYTKFRLDDGGVPGAIANLETFLADELNIEPILDVLKGENEELKRGTITFLGRVGSAEAVGLLKKCLSDPSSEVRLYAHSTLARLDEKQMLRIKEAQFRVDHQKEDRIENLKQLGETCRNYADSGLPEETARDHYLELAKEAFMEALLLAPEDPEIPLVLGKLCADRKEYREAEVYLRKVMHVTSNHAEPLIELCEIYFEKGDMMALAETAKQLGLVKGQYTGDPHRDALIQFWAVSPDA